jgi:chaperonin GroES
MRHFVVVLLCLLLLLPCLTLALSSSVNPNKTKYYGGAGIGRLVIDDKVGKEGFVQCHYDMVLCERIQGRAKSKSGLFIPDEDLPRLHLCRVLSMGPGREEENGRIAPMPDIKIGDIVIAKNPWGIGPKDEETADGKKLSYMRSQDIAAVIPGGILPEDE